MRLWYFGPTYRCNETQRLKLSCSGLAVRAGARVRPGAQRFCPVDRLPSGGIPPTSVFKAIQTVSPTRLVLRSAVVTLPAFNVRHALIRSLQGPLPSPLTPLTLSGISTRRALATNTNTTRTTENNTNATEAVSTCVARSSRNDRQPTSPVYDAYWPPLPTTLGPIPVAPPQESSAAPDRTAARPDTCAAAVATTTVSAVQVPRDPATAAAGDMADHTAVDDPFKMDLREVVAAAAAAPGAAAGSAGNGDAAVATGPAGDGKAVPAVDVTRHNFEVMLPAVKRYLAACDFFAFDCEMTGLFLEGQIENYLDDMQDRYTRVISPSAQSYVINQFGLSCFRRVPEPGPGGEPAYLAATFNFYLFPRPPEGAPFGSSRRFLSDAGSLTFLANQGFDFNRCIYDGVPFVPVRQRDEMLRQLDRDNSNNKGGAEGGGDARSDVPLTKPEDQEFVRSMLDVVKRWLDEQAPEPLDLPAVNGYLRLLTYQALGRPENFGGPPGGAPDWHPGFYVTKIQDERNWTRVRLVRATAAEAAALEAAEREQRRAAAVATAGFAAVWDAMRDCGRPAVGHNCMFDVAYGVSQFGEGRLPVTWEGFKRAVAHWFRGGVYDTKYICRQLPDVLGTETSLSTMYRCLVPQAQPADTKDAVVAAVPPALPARVSVAHARGFEKYGAVAAGQLAHEAGYDAFMTGSVFAGLEALTAARATATAVKDVVEPESTEAATPKVKDEAETESMEVETPAVKEEAPAAVPPPSPPEPYATVQPYMWRLNVSRSDLPYAFLRPTVPGDPSTVEPVPERPLVFHLGTLSYGTRAGDIHKAFEETGLGKVRITFLPGNNALVELESEEGAARLREGGLLEARGLCAEVLPYVQYRARKDEMLAAGTWPLPAASGGPRLAAAGGRAGGANAAGAGVVAAPAAAAANPAAQRPAKRPRVESEEEPQQPQGSQRQCLIM